MKKSIICKDQHGTINKAYLYYCVTRHKKSFEIHNVVLVWTLADCASIIFGIICYYGHNFVDFTKKVMLA